MWASWSKALFSERMSSHSFSLSREASPIPSLHATANTGQPLLFWFRTTRFSCRLFLFFIYHSPDYQCVALPLAINSLQTLYREWRNIAHPLLGPAQHLLLLFQSYCDPYFVLLRHKEAYIGLQTNHLQKHFWRSLDTI